MPIVTTIPWGDGSGDNIYLSRNASEGNQTVDVSSDANTGVARSKVITFTSGVGSITQLLTVSQEAGGPQEYTITKYPSSLDSENTIVDSWVSGYGYSRGFTSASSSSEARANWVKGRNAETFVFWKFDLNDIPDNATILSVELKAKARRSAGGTSVVSDAHLAVCNGTTPVGSTTTIPGSTATTFTLDVGSGWTGASIKNLSILQYCKRGTSNTTNTYFLGFYGATLTVKYTI